MAWLIATRFLGESFTLYKLQTVENGFKEKVSSKTRRA